MAILIDPPAWPAHGTIWSHLVSDTSYDELHAFARRLGFPRRSFDLDHYDVSAANYDRAVALGALPVSGREVVHRLRNTGLRVRQVDRAAITPVRRQQYLRDEWARLGELLAGQAPDRPAPATDPAWAALGEDLLARWTEPHRRYHDERHLEDVLLALDHLASRGERIAPETLLAAWFHDAVYTGAVPTSAAQAGGTAAGETGTGAGESRADETPAGGTRSEGSRAEDSHYADSRAESGHADEQRSAALAVAELTRLAAVRLSAEADLPAFPGLTPSVIESVRAQIIATTPASSVDGSGDPAAIPSPPVAHLLDADLWIFASHPTRYADYAASVRLEYAHVPDDAFARGRSTILESYLSNPNLYATEAARELWEARARANVAREIAQLRG
ncbi:DUF4031 domain-containing protein [Leucobacter japonicus]|uniref:DUF4031 domain-containing protein n=1 Tax=Leucobacter japonicus TaxID=1461259 RepID=UPI0006A794AD|nr:DUF4031 domain-containing protein [Leucobacter japonicus]